VRLNFDPRREEDELRNYLGDEYDHSRLQRSQESLDAEWERCDDEAAFYRTSEAYLYNLTAFAMTGTKLPYLRQLTRHVPAGARLLDFGCGIGSDGLMLLEAGYDVEFADFANPSTTYLRWRLTRRGYQAAVYDLDRDVPGGFDATYAFDVIEHVSDPLALLAEMERRAKLVQVNLLAPVPEDQDLHHELPIRRLLAYATTRQLVAYERLHRRSHLVLYRPVQVGLGRRAGNLIRLAAGYR
jgi:SAM-dependent methyltransferase